MTRPEAPKWWVIIAMLIGTFAANAATTLVIVKAVQRGGEETRRIVCEVVISQAELGNDPDAPPISERGRRAAAAWERMSVRFGCGR